MHIYLYVLIPTMRYDEKSFHQMHVLPLNWQQAHQSTQITTSLGAFAGFFFLVFVYLFIYCNGSFLGAKHSHAFYWFSSLPYHLFFSIYRLEFYTIDSAKRMLKQFLLLLLLLQQKEKPTPFARLPIYVYAYVQFNQFTDRITCLICILYAQALMCAMCIERCRMNPSK